jgi:1-hydroxycarotenoid 3,4-desaturase
LADLDRRPVIIAGAGIGGLACAIELSRAGIPVMVLERGDVVGGKLHQHHIQGVGIDSGPTVFTMRWVFDTLLAGAGSTLESIVRIRRADILARHAWSGDERLDLHASREASAHAIESFSSKAEADRFLKFCDTASTAYRALEAAYIRSERPSFLSMQTDLGVRGLQALWRIGLFQSLWTSLDHKFKDRRLHQLFSRYATYCGMTALANALAGEATRLGAVIRTQAGVKAITLRSGRVQAVVLENDERIEGSAVVFNGDIAALRSGVVAIASDQDIMRDAVEGPSDVARNAFGTSDDDFKSRSLSALTLSMHAATEGFPLTHHNLFFHDDYASEFDDIFQRRRLPAKPTVYICAQDRHDHASPPDGPERLLLLINAPATGDRHTFEDAEVQACIQAGSSLMERCGLRILRNDSNTRITTPDIFHQRFPATGGALYGHATHGWMSAFRRHGAVSRIPGLYLAGGSVHPGPGVPMAAMSGRLAAAALMGHRGLTRPSRRVVISGGMSTH